MRLLVTRPEPEAERTAELLRAAGHVVIVEPMLTIVPSAEAAIRLDGVEALLVTSANALRALSTHKGLPALLRYRLFAVGSATASLARQMGFAQVTAGPGTALSLVPVLAAALPPGRTVLHLAGETRAADLTQPLARAGLQLRTSVVYRTAARDRLSARVADALQAGGVDGVVIMSPRTARIFAALCRSAGVLPVSGLAAFCLSQACADELGDLEARTLVASRPDMPALLALIAQQSAQLPRSS